MDKERVWSPRTRHQVWFPQITLTRLGAGLQMWRCRRKGPGQIPETGEDRTGRDRFADVELNALDALKALRLITLDPPC
jgi:hypothetical protein